MGDTAKIKRAAARIVDYRKKGYNVVVVVSALGDTTDELLKMAHRINRTPSSRELDMLMSTGEQVSVALLAMAIHKLGWEAISFTGSQAGFITDARHTRARILDINPERIKRELRVGRVVIVAGFQGRSLDQEITTLGRGGSDMSGVALAKVLGASCEIYTDVDGVYTADPRIVRNARKLENVSYEEMLELASLGTQVLQSRSVEAASKYDIPVHVRSSFNKSEGTWITKEVSAMEGVLVRGVTINRDEAKITICDVPDRPGVAVKIFGKLADDDINVDMIIQNISRTGATDVSFTVNGSDLGRTLKSANAISKKIGAGGVTYDRDIAKVSVVGVGMKSHSGVASKMFKALASRKINIGMISTSEIKISCVIEKSRARDAVRAIHKEFRLGKKNA